MLRDFVIGNDSRQIRVFRNESELRRLVTRVQQNADAADHGHCKQGFKEFNAGWHQYTNMLARTHALRPQSPCTKQDICNRSEEHPSELQSLMRISYAVFCLKKKPTQTSNNNNPYVHTSTHKT